MQIQLLSNPAVGAEPFRIDLIEVTPRQFNPSIHEQAKVVFRLNRDGQVLFKIYDRRTYQVREIAKEYLEANKKITLAWNGRDDQGRLVPNEAYFFTLDAADVDGNLAEYDPTATMTVHHDPVPVEYHQDSAKLSFNTAIDAVVDLRAGIANGGPLLARLVEWKPYFRGEHQVDWDGWDSEHVNHVNTIPGFQLYLQTSPLPENSLLATGHPDGSDQIYSVLYASDELRLKPELDNRIFTQLTSTPHKSLTPDFTFAFDNAQSDQHSLPIVGDIAGITIRLKESIKQRVTEARYEVLVFVDYQFFTEIEEGRSPARISVDTTSLAAGEHVLSINLVTLQGDLAVLSKRFIKSE